MTQTAAVAEEPTMPGVAVPTRALVLAGFFLGSVVATTLTKLALRSCRRLPAGVDAAAVNDCTRRLCCTSCACFASASPGVADAIDEGRPID